MIPILDIVNVGMKVLDRVLPDPKAKAEAQMELLKMSQADRLADLQADLQTSLGQLEVNKAEATSGNSFTSGWRPGVGWVGVLGLLYSFLLQPLLAWVSLIRHVPSPPPLDMTVLFTLLGGILGLGGMRTAEKIQGVSK
jgi:hypothetical protein